MNDEQHQRAQLAVQLIAARIATGFNIGRVDGAVIAEMVALAKRIQTTVVLQEGDQSG
jgi:hypothetical protein